MIQEELEELFTYCPVLYHMAEAKSWGSIRQHGLLSTSALLDLYAIGGEERFVIESCHRPESVSICSPRLCGAVVRDQKPMTDKSLSRALNGSMSNTEWYRLLNKRVFFWLTRERLLRLLGAAAYRDREHDVLELETRAVVNDYFDKITLSPINSGCTRPFPHYRDGQTFRTIHNYPYQKWRKGRGAKGAVVELCVENGIYNVSKYVKRVTRMRGNQVLVAVFEA